MEAIKNATIGCVPGISYKQGLKFAQTCFELQEHISLQDILRTPDIKEIYETLENIRDEGFIRNYFGTNHTKEEEYYKEFLSSANAKEVIRNIDHYKEVPDLSTQKEFNNYYIIDLNQVRTEPDKKEAKQNYLVYIYPIISFLSLVVIIITLIKRKGNKK
jgi:spore cortex formation protein SpoVR/YcgB (stage V sporulation)